MKSKWFLVAYEGVFNGRALTAESIKSMVDNFNNYENHISVVYDFYSWSPELGKVLDIKTEVVDGKVCLFAKITETTDLKEFVDNGRVPHYPAVAVSFSGGNDNRAVLSSIAATQTPIIPGLDLIQFGEGKGKI